MFGHSLSFNVETCTVDKSSRSLKHVSIYARLWAKASNDGSYIVALRCIVVTWAHSRRLLFFSAVTVTPLGVSLNKLYTLMISYIEQKLIGRNILLRTRRVIHHAYHA